MYTDSSVGEVYALHICGSPTYFYVGVTKYDATARLSAHLDQVARGNHSNKRFTQMVRDAGVENVALKVLERPAFAFRWEREEWWIKKLLEDGHPLVNRIHNELHVGISGCTVQEARERMAELIQNPPKPPSARLAPLYADAHEAIKSAYRFSDRYLEMFGDGEIEADE